MTKQRDKACKQDINRILLLDSDSLGFESFGFGILNCPSLKTGFQYHHPKLFCSDVALLLDTCVHMYNCSTDFFPGINFCYT